MRLRTIAPILAVSILALAGCGNNTDTAQGPKSSPTASPTQSVSPTATDSPSPQQTYDAPEGTNDTGTETPPPGDDVDSGPVTVPTDAKEQFQANSDAAAGKDITLRVSTTGPGSVSWMGMANGESGDEPVTGSWSKEFPSAGAGLYVVNVQTDDLQGEVTCEVLEDGVIKDTDTGDGIATCAQPAEASGS